MDKDINQNYVAPMAIKQITDSFVFLAGFFCDLMVLLNLDKQLKMSEISRKKVECTALKTLRQSQDRSIR